MVKYWDKYTEMHGQQNVKTLLSIRHDLSRQFTHILKYYENLWLSTYKNNTKTEETEVDVGWETKGNEVCEES